MENLFRQSPFQRFLTDEDFAKGCKLLRACANNSIDAVPGMLLADPWLITFSDYDQRTCLHVAASEGHLALITMLLDRGAKTSPSDRWGGSPLDDAMRHNKPEAAELLRRHGATLGVADRTSAMIVASSKGDIAELQTLLSHGASPNSSDYDRRTPLHLAASEGHLDAITLLIDAGSNVNSEDRWMNRPFDDARRKGHAQCEAALCAVGATAGPGRSSSRTLVGGDFEGLEVDWSDVTIIEKIGAGAFGEIFKCRWRGTLVAAKRLKNLGESRHGGTLMAAKLGLSAGSPGTVTKHHMEALGAITSEIAVLSKLRHPHVCMLLGFSLEDRREVMIIELMKCSLQDVLKAQDAGSKFPLQRTARYAIQCAMGMNYLHTQRPPILHRDLKPENLLLDFADVLKVGDFGLAKLRDTTDPNASAEAYQPYVMTGETGSYRYMAPEVFRHEPYGRPVDVYSFAMIFCYMLQGYQPWPETQGLEACRRAALEDDRPIIPRHWDEGLAKLLRTAWAAKPESRPSFAAVIEELHSFHQRALKTTYEDEMTKGPDGSGCCSVM